MNKCTFYSQAMDDTEEFCVSIDAEGEEDGTGGFHFNVYLSHDDYGDLLDCMLRAWNRLAENEEL